MIKIHDDDTKCSCSLIRFANIWVELGGNSQWRIIWIEFGFITWVIKCFEFIGKNSLWIALELPVTRSYGYIKPRGRATSVLRTEYTHCDTRCAYTWGAWELPLAPAAKVYYMAGKSSIQSAGSNTSNTVILVQSDWISNWQIGFFSINFHEFYRCIRYQCKLWELFFFKSVFRWDRDSITSVVMHEAWLFMHEMNVSSKVNLKARRTREKGRATR